MKRVFLYLSIIGLLLTGCKNSGNGELIGVQRKNKFYQPDPYGMAYVPMGSFTMGVGDQDVPYSQLHQPKTISITPFFMDETEITNNEYRQFVYWVRDSIARQLLSETLPEKYLIEEDPKTKEVIDPPVLNWEQPIEWNGENERDVLEEMFLPEHERFFRKKEIDTRKLFYEYYWYDWRAAARKDYSQPADARNGAFANRPQGLKDRSTILQKDYINVYPDTLVWIHDFAYSYNEPVTQMYFWHPAYDNYPVVGVSWKQAKAFCVWRSELMRKYLNSNNEATTSPFRLPSEAEWEWAARGGYEGNPYPWGGPYTRNGNGCFLANFKPMRGDYVDDGGLRTIMVGHYPPNDFNLYDMAGNVAEWVNDAFDESAYNVTWDMSPAYTYDAKDDDPIVLKRKVVRGGSWKDVAYYLNVTTRSYEYQDTAKSYIGFRCVQDYMFRQKGDNPNSASRVY